MPTPKSKKQDYEIMLTSTQVHCTTVKAASAEEACRILQRKIAGKAVINTSTTTTVIGHTWSDPTENGEGWIVAQTGHAQEGTMKTWDGKQLGIFDVGAASRRALRTPSEKRS